MLSGMIYGPQRLWISIDGASVKNGLSERFETEISPMHLST